MYHNHKTTFRYVNGAVVAKGTPVPTPQPPREITIPGEPNPTGRTQPQIRVNRPRRTNFKTSNGAVVPAVTQT